MGFGFPSLCVVQFRGFLCFFSLIYSVFASCSNPDPLQFPFGNVSLADDLRARGISLSIGTNPQQLSFEVNGAGNNTFVFNGNGSCASNVAPRTCYATRGGIFNQTLSTSWVESGSQQAAGASAEYHLGFDIYSSSWGTDTLHVNSSLSLKTFPLVMQQANQWSSPMNPLGLGRNSTFLNSLFSAGLIGSRSWSIFTGWTGDDPDYQMDGSLVVGGYDKAKTTGSGLTIPVTNDGACGTGLQVTVTDMTISFENGTTFGIFGPSDGSALEMCIDPARTLMTLPQDIWNNFQNQAGGSLVGGPDAELTNADRSPGINLWGMLYEADGVFDGNLTVVLSSGLRVVIPNHQLVGPSYVYNKNGVLVNQNTSVREIMVSGLKDVNKNDMPLLGQTFLSSAYLLVDHDRSQFTLWSLNATKEENLRAVPGTQACASPTSSPTKSTVPSQPSTSTTLSGSTVPSGSSTLAGTLTTVSSQPSSSSKDALVHLAIIIGATVGGSTLVGIAALIFCCRCIRKRRREREAAQAALEGSQQNFIEYKNELASEPRPLQELSPDPVTVRQVIHELPPQPPSKDWPRSNAFELPG